MLELLRLYIDYDLSFLEAEELLPGIRELALQGKEDELYAKTQTAVNIFKSFIPFEEGGLRNAIKIKFKTVNGGANPPGRTGGTREQFGEIYIPDTDHTTSKTLITNAALASRLNIGLAGLHGGASYRKSLEAFAAVSPPRKGEFTAGWVKRAQDAAAGILNG